MWLVAIINLECAPLRGHVPYFRCPYWTGAACCIPDWQPAVWTHGASQISLACSTQSQTTTPLLYAFAWAALYFQAYVSGLLVYRSTIYPHLQMPTLSVMCCCLAHATCLGSTLSFQYDFTGCISIISIHVRGVYILYQLEWMLITTELYLRPWCKLCWTGWTDLHTWDIVAAQLSVHASCCST